MNSRPYSDCIALALALAGVPDTNADEVARVKRFLNRRARRAYGESPFWPRWYVAGEERIVSSEGLLPYSEDDKLDIGTCLRIHATEPYKDEPAGEYHNFVAESEGVQVQGYCQREHSEGADTMVVTGAINPDVSGTYVATGTQLDRTTYNLGAYNIEPSYFSGGFIGWSFAPASGFGFDLWTSTDLVDSPDLVTTWTPVGSNTGTPIVTATTLYSAWVTYQAAFTTTYGEDEGEEDEVPDEWSDYMAHGACADWLRAEKEYEAAALMEADGFNFLVPHLERVSRQSGQHVTTRILTHANLQAR